MSQIALEYLNVTELRQMLAKDGRRVKASVPKERLVHLIQYGERPQPDEISGTAGTRTKLQNWVERNWANINSQLPCHGENRGRCTVYPCSDGKHLDCFLAANECKT